MVFQAASVLIKLVLLAIFLVVGAFAYAVQTWEEPCPVQSTVYVPYPCGEEGK
jgi:hypothetical protein